MRELDMELFKHLKEIKKLQDVKNNLIMKFEVNAKDHSRYTSLQNELRDTERIKGELMLRYESLEDQIDNTRVLIRKNAEDSGKDAKVVQLREAVNETKQQAKLLDKEYREGQHNEKVFERVLKANEEQKGLKREI